MGYFQSLSFDLVCWLSVVKLLKGVGCLVDVLIRNLDIVAVSKIDQEAKKKRLSRNELLKVYIDKFALVDMHNEERILYKESFEMNTRMLHAFGETQKNLVGRVGNIEKVLVRMIELETNEKECAD
ncbi:hypothetical protein H7992_05085 [Sporosarcina sp. resist]|uniref:hypothetical protein n=1 Tax=Sporosarcina sp. resist TaxID=2762563 RepID=UPI00164DC36B|nr:hypothetical protein [Sporosarcina sp. resist]QNK89100.1 hypothetical protein H7992_05085 [Sporosarcina sp. resist]